MQIAHCGENKSVKPPNENIHKIYKIYKNCIDEKKNS